MRLEYVLLDIFNEEVEEVLARNGERRPTILEPRKMPSRRSKMNDRRRRRTFSFLLGALPYIVSQEHRLRSLFIFFFLHSSCFSLYSSGLSFTPEALVSSLLLFHCPV